jgi:predicted AAA+ superfamily ATPase
LGLVREGLEQFPAVALLGLRQIGKTSLALELGTLMPSVYLDLEAPADRAKLADPALYLSALAARLVILDEVQRMPELFATLRGLIDAEQRQGQRSGRFLLLGSASVQLIRQASESLTGRIHCLPGARRAECAGVQQQPI